MKLQHTIDGETRLPGNPHYTEMVRCLAFITVIVLCAFGNVSAAVDIMPLKDIRAGMIGVGKTVFTGDKVEDFRAEILGILANTGPKESLILARLSGGPLEHTGVMQGM